ncbi:hypothetical protein OG394_22250 [Kribbella sp. NBC_01245]|uniref:hypothetical protein n=1 Tax=Kribbella sp. NBC_01245 TaxID=2903578 RepID=UPI002E2BD84B|nr:hypothetical protein [Kribbella sp. NBC_01245]
MTGKYRPVPVQALLCGRWVAAEVVAVRRTSTSGAVRQVLLEHHGHLEWIDAALVRRDRVR